MATIEPTAGILDATIEQGATFEILCTYKTSVTGPAIDITGCSIKIQIRVDADKTPVFATLNTPDEITLVDPTNGVFKVLMDDTLTSTFPNKDCKWDCFIKFPNGRVKKFWKGDLTMDPNITEPST